ncbi:glucosyltransferase domain-containing protein [Enterobacter kobei]|uniref:glucosyltransferase domain-containing protein n=1 Tax=Enterobacter kobei TaxID=208224 RepID=UPI0018680DE4|nr:glucosyltransferase domain-containing protein [Enterobacter kobei]
MIKSENNMSVNLKPMLLIFGFILFCYYNVLSTNYYYIDDLGRSLEGYSGWSRNGRPLADLFFYVISFGAPLPDISPLPQILGIALLSLGAYLTGKTYLWHSEGAGLSFLLCLPLAISPFYFENMSYKYDAFPMSLSVLCAMLPFVVRINGSLKLLTACVVSILVSLCLYQASLNIYIIYTMIYVLNKFKVGKDSDGLKAIGLSITGLLTGYIIYSLLISPNFIEGDYNLQHSQISSFELTSLRDAIFGNFKVFYYVLSTSMSTTMLALIVMIACMAIISSVKLCCEKSDSTGVIKLLRNTIILVSPLLVLLMIAGPMLLLKSAVVSARVFVAFGAILVFYNILACWMLGLRSKIMLVLSILYFFYMLGAAFSYGNALDNQEKYDNEVITTIISDLNKNNLANAKHISFIGMLPISPEGRLAIKKYPFFAHLIHPTINGRWSWGLRHIKHFDMSHDFNSGEFHSALKDNLCEYTSITNGVIFNSYYDKKSDSVIYDFTKRSCE